MTRTGFLPLARPTFDVPYAEEQSATALSALRQLEPDTTGRSDLAMDIAEVVTRLEEEALQDTDVLVVFQATFADTTLVREIADRTEAALVLWAVPEPEVGGRLRLNSFCGINLAAYLLARRGADYRWVHRSPEDASFGNEMRQALTRPISRTVSARPPNPGSGAISLEGVKVGVVGNRPDGFEPCDFDPALLEETTGVVVDETKLEDWFAAGSNVSETKVDSIYEQARTDLEGIDDLDPTDLARSLQLAAGLEDLANSREWAGVSTRCWPECFTEYGGAACYGNARMTSLGIPGCCEADVYGNVTALLLARLSDSPPFVADLVGLDYETDTATFWHCGMAAPELAAETSARRATVHSNRQKPLLNEFVLRPGRVTICRLSQSSNETRLVIGGAEMLETEAPFTGTSGVARLDGTASQARDVIMGNGLEHHYGLAYGDHRQALEDYADSIGIQVIDL